VKVQDDDDDAAAATAAATTEETATAAISFAKAAQDDSQGIFFGRKRSLISQVKQCFDPGQDHTTKWTPIDS